MRGLQGPKAKAPHALAMAALLCAASMVFFCLSVRRRVDVRSPLCDDQFDLEDRKLLKVPKEASMGDRTVVLTILKSPEWAKPGSLFDLFLESFRLGHGTKPFLNNLVVFTVDGQSLRYCKSVQPYCFSLANHRFNHAAWKPFRDLQHLKLGWRKIELIEEVIRLGYNIISTDADVMWFRNPFQHFHSNFDMIVAQDSCSDTLESTSSKTDGGFFFLKANEISLEFVKYWRMVRALNPTSNDQFAFENIKNEASQKYWGCKSNTWREIILAAYANQPGI